MTSVCLVPFKTLLLPFAFYQIRILMLYCAESNPLATSLSHLDLKIPTIVVSIYYPQRHEEDLSCCDGLINCIRILSAELLLYVLSSSTISASINVFATWGSAWGEKIASRGFSPLGANYLRRSSQQIKNVNQLDNLVNLHTEQ
jgi:hypothetical protein